MTVVEDIIAKSPHLLVELSSREGENSVFQSDIRLADALKAWKKQRLLTRLAKAASYKEEREAGASQVDAQAVAREKNKTLSEREIELEADYYRCRAERDYLNGKLMTVRQLTKYHEAPQE